MLRRILITFALVILIAPTVTSAVSIEDYESGWDLVFRINAEIWEKDLKTAFELMEEGLKKWPDDEYLIPKRKDLMIEKEINSRLNLNHGVIISDEHIEGQKRLYLWSERKEHHSAYEIIQWGFAYYQGDKLKQVWESGTERHVSAGPFYDIEKLDLTKDGIDEYLIASYHGGNGGGVSVFVLMQKNGQWDLAFEEYSYIPGVRYLISEDNRHLIEGMYRDFDGDGLVELAIFDMGVGFCGHPPALMNIYQWRGNHFAKVNEQFGAAYAPLEKHILSHAPFIDVTYPGDETGYFYMSYIAKVRDIAGEAQAPTWSGTINNKWPIKMALTINEGKICGTYYYEKYKQNIVLIGEIYPEQKIVMREYDKDENLAATFSGKMSATQIEGTWKSIDNSKKYDFKVTLEATNATEE